MPSQRSEITEIVTGLAMLGYQSIERALEVRPGHITHVTADVFDRLEAAHRAGGFAREFSLAWNNGVAFARAEQGLRGRPPWLLEWKGHHRPASRTIETIPADLRVDHVYLISAKYGSQILHNSGPAQLFDHCLAPGPGPSARIDWYHHIAPDAYRAIWEPVHTSLGIGSTTPPMATSAAERARIKRHLADAPMPTSSDAYRWFVAEVSRLSAMRWRERIGDLSGQREMLWRLLRMQAAPYYLLGASRQGEALRYRISTPWDFSQSHTLDELVVRPGQRGQPSVDWSATITHNHTGVVSEVTGYVEIRWSHHKLQGPPEAKVHLTTHPYGVPGYEPLTLPEAVAPVPVPVPAARITAHPQALW